MALRLRWCVWLRLAGGDGVATALLRGVVAKSMRLPHHCNDLPLGGQSGRLEAGREEEQHAEWSGG